MFFSHGTPRLPCGVKWPRLLLLLILLQLLLRIPVLAKFWLEPKLLAWLLALLLVFRLAVGFSVLAFGLAFGFAVLAFGLAYEAKSEARSEANGEANK